MELKTISTSVRKRATVNGMTIEATLNQRDGKIRVESGSINDVQTEAYLGSFGMDGETANYNLNTADREKRAAMVELIEDFISELKNAENV
ncbi:MAG: hypothetical protein K2M07_06845 [Muribaculaceae bacterium]|nr:hypothetical protein [Muribaculaceae bacterium]